jgi:hypothetical protein
MPKWYGLQGLIIIIMYSVPGIIGRQVTYAHRTELKLAAAIAQRHAGGICLPQWAACYATDTAIGGPSLLWLPRTLITQQVQTQ